jgi:hypothetical protein
MLVSPTLVRRCVQHTGGINVRKLFWTTASHPILRGLATRRLRLGADVSSEFAANATEIGGRDLAPALMSM